MVFPSSLYRIAPRGNENLVFQWVVCIVHGLYQVPNMMLKAVGIIDLDTAINDELDSITSLRGFLQLQTSSCATEVPPDILLL
mmetsp:Transcript_12709/g.27620  ORF Transcript_12709/g.27620 Transcript_12709/m.27620 type:complete len:83 (-) Transcript_12709:681-929(-)